MKKSIFLLVILALFSFISSCKKDTNDTIETEEVFLTEEQNSVFENTEEIDGFDSTNVILPNGETLENVIMELGAGYQKSLTKFDPRYTDLKMRTKTLTRALYLASLKKNTYPAAGPDKPEQVGIAYCYGGKDPFSRTKPIQSKCIDNIYGVDCAGFIYACFISSGIDLTRLVNGKKKHFGSNEIRKPETLRNKILEAYPEFGDYQVKDLGKISKEKILSGDIVYFKNTNGSVFHVGMFVRKKDGPIAFYNSNGTPDGCVANLTIKRGVRALNSGGYNDSAYWFKNYSWGITRLVGPLTIVKTKSVSQKKNGTTIFSGGEIIDPGASDIIAKGVCWSKSPFPTIFENKTDDGQGPNNYTSSIIGLDDNTPYYIRSYTTNSHGTSYGNMITYQSQNINYGTATDIDGNVYKTVVIGNQEWFAENLKTTKFNDGSVIPQISDDNSWSQLTSPAYCWYNNQPEFSNPYGALYNWYSVNDSRHLCPTGWHIPTFSEYKDLENAVGGIDIAGARLKEADTLHWISPNLGASNESGFTALPGGHRNNNPTQFIFLHSYCLFWTNESYIENRAWCKRLDYDNTKFLTFAASINDGLSVRCIKD